MGNKKPNIRYKKYKSGAELSANIQEGLKRRAYQKSGPLGLGKTGPKQAGQTLRQIPRDVYFFLNENDRNKYRTYKPTAAVLANPVKIEDLDLNTHFTNVDEFGTGHYYSEKWTERNLGERRSDPGRAKGDKKEKKIGIVNTLLNSATGMVTFSVYKSTYLPSLDEKDLPPFIKRGSGGGGDDDDDDDNELDPNTPESAETLYELVAAAQGAVMDACGIEFVQITLGNGDVVSVPTAESPSALSTERIMVSEQYVGAFHRHSDLVDLEASGTFPQGVGGNDITSLITAYKSILDHELKQANNEKNALENDPDSDYKYVKPPANATAIIKKYLDPNSSDYLEAIATYFTTEGKCSKEDFSDTDIALAPPFDNMADVQKYLAQELEPFKTDTSNTRANALAILPDPFNAGSSRKEEYKGYPLDHKWGGSTKKVATALGKTLCGLFPTYPSCSGGGGGGGGGDTEETVDIVKEAGDALKEIQKKLDDMELGAGSDAGSRKRGGVHRRNYRRGGKIQKTVFKNPPKYKEGGYLYGKFGFGLPGFLKKSKKAAAETTEAAADVAADVAKDSKSWSQRFSDSGLSKRVRQGTRTAVVGGTAAGFLGGIFGSAKNFENLDVPSGYNIARKAQEDGRNFIIAASSEGGTTIQADLTAIVEQYEIIEAKADEEGLRTITRTKLAKGKQEGKPGVTAYYKFIELLRAFVIKLDSYKGLTKEEIERQRRGVDIQVKSLEFALGSGISSLGDLFRGLGNTLSGGIYKSIRDKFGEYEGALIRNLARNSNKALSNWYIEGINQGYSFIDLTKQVVSTNQEKFIDHEKAGNLMYYHAAVLDIAYMTNTLLSKPELSRKNFNEIKASINKFYDSMPSDMWAAEDTGKGVVFNGTWDEIFTSLSRNSLPLRMSADNKEVVGFKYMTPATTINYVKKWIKYLDTQISGNQTEEETQTAASNKKGGTLNIKKQNSVQERFNRRIPVIDSILHNLSN